MRDMDISDLSRSANNSEQLKFIRTSVSMKPHSEPEIVLLMRSARSRFLKSLDEGKIQIKSEREWILR